MAKPLLIFDGDCGFCRRWIAYWEALTGDRVEYASYQEVGHRFPAISRERFQSAVQLVEADGHIASGADAVLRTLAYRPGLRWAHWLYQKVPGVAAATEFAYQLVARNRVAFSRLSHLLFGDKIEPARFGLVRWLYVKGLAVTYLIAFSSFWVQAKGLVGPQGVMPSGMSESSIDLLCAAGCASSVLLMMAGSALGGWLSTAAAIASWAAYWFVVGVGQEFLAFQWDALMLEMGFFSIFLTFGKNEPFRPAIWLLRWLLFRVVFFSGFVKLASQDPHWRDLSALQFHFETQPLPTWIGWAFHQMPPVALKIGAAAMFGLELIIPFLYFLPRKPRIFAFFATVAFQILIDLTGNYGFFGLQVGVLAVLLLDDQFVRDHVPTFSRFASPKGAASKSRTWVEGTLLIPVILLVLFTTVFKDSPPAPTVARLAAPLNSIHSYGVFAVMTTTRNEIIFEGSRDGKNWLPYELKWKPGDLKRRPSFVEPHMPRLDWQLWFAALGDPGQNPWIESVAARLLEGSPQVLALFGTVPFAESPPKYIRASFYQYRFTNNSVRTQSGDWWHRELIGLYLPPVSLKNL